MAEARAALKRLYELSGVKETGRELGRGSFASVVEVEYNGVKCAAKRTYEVLYRTGIREQNERMYQRVQDELLLHSELNHPNIVQFIGVYYPTTGGPPGLVMELLPTGLTGYLDEHGVQANETTCSILRDVALGLHYLHDLPQPVMHRDLSANSVLLTEDLRAKICDFNSAKILTLGTRFRAMTPCPGTAVYMPPEAFSHEPHYGIEIDIFSYGVLTLHTCTGRYPIPGASYARATDGKLIPQSEVERRQEYLDKMGPNDPLRSLITDCLSNHPAHRPTATQILHRLQEVISGHQNSKRLFDEAMKHGYVEAALIVLLLIGTAGAGKTHAKHLFLGLPPPDLRQSTPLAEEAIRAISTLRAMVSGTSDMVWDLVTVDELKKMIAEAVKALAAKAGESRGHSVPSLRPLSQPRSVVGEPTASKGHITEKPRDPSEPRIQGDASEPSQEALPQTLPPRHVQEEELVDLITSSSESKKLFDVDWVYLVDSGGQPSFHEILPLFMHVASAVAFVVKLNERLSDKPTVEWYGEDGKCGSSYASLLTNEEILHHSIQGMRSRQSLTPGESGPQIFVVGTHKDRERECPESRREKNSTLLSILRPQFGDNLAYYSIAGTEELIFPVNAKEPTEEDRKVAEKFRRMVISKGRAQARVKIPLPWYVLEQYLRQLAAELSRKILHISECEEEAKKLHMNAEACEEALKFLDKVNMFFYRPDHLKGLVLCSSQVWLDKISELIELMHQLQGRLETSPVNDVPDDTCCSERVSSEPNEAVDLTSTEPPMANPARGNGKIVNFFRSLFQAFHRPQRDASHTTNPASDQQHSHDEESLPAPPQVGPYIGIPSSQDGYPDTSEFCDSEGIKFRNHGIVTVNILNRFPKHYVDGLFTPTELLKVLTAFLVTAPLSDGSHEYVMPCLLQGLSPQEVADYRQLTPSPAAPLLIQFPDNWVPAGVFIVLTAYLQNLPDWKLCLSPSGNPRCLHRNCVEFYLPTGHGGYVTLIDSFEYLEVHVRDASDNACQKACPRIAADIQRGIKETARRLHYGTLQLKTAFLCSTPSPACRLDHHLATVIDDELVCSVSRRKTGEIQDQHRFWLVKESPGLDLDPEGDERTVPVPVAVSQPTPRAVQVDPSEPPTMKELMKLLYREVPHQWYEIGHYLEIRAPELESIRAKKLNDPQQCLPAMLDVWLHRSRPAPSWEAITEALEIVGREDIAGKIGCDPPR